MKDWQGQIILAFLTAGFVGFFYGNILRAPNDYMIAGRDDGIKNYFVFAHHVKHGEKYLELSSMNHPYGELLILDDSHPVLVVAVKAIANLFPALQDQSVGIINILLLISVFLSAYFLFLIFRHFLIRMEIAIIGSLAITALCSQVILWGYGHWALGYICCFPMGWFLIIKIFNSKSSSKWMLLGLANTLFWLYIHPYLGLTLVMFNFFCLVMNQLVGYSNIKKIRSYSLLFAIPLLWYVLSIKLLDTHPERGDAFFIDNHIATLRSIFVSKEPPFNRLFDWLQLSGLTSSWDNVGNYIGLTTILILAIYLGYVLLKLVRRKTHLNDLFPKEWVIYWCSALIILLYAMAWPFKAFSDLDLGPFSVLMQFTGLGRFAWVFYFVATSFSVYLLSRYFSSNRIKLIVSCSLLAVLFVEGMALHAKIAEHATDSRNLFLDEHLPTPLRDASKAIDPYEFQAIIALPFYYHNSNPYAFAGSDMSIRQSMVLSQHTGLPLVNAYLPRPSVEEGRKVMQIFSPPHYKKEIVHDLNSKKPFLIYHTGEELNTLEQNILSRAEKIPGVERLFSVEFNVLFQNNSGQVIESYINRKPGLVKEGKLWLSEPGNVIHLDFEDQESDVAFLGNGAFVRPNDGSYVIYEYSPVRTSLSAEDNYMISLWYYNKNIRQTYANLELSVKENASGDLVSQIYANPFQSGEIYGNWTKVEIPARIETGHTATLSVNVDNPIRDFVYIDEVLIRPLSVEVFQEKMKKDVLMLMKNNSVYEK